MRLLCNSAVPFLALSLPLAVAQTYSKCNPTESSSCSADTALSSGSYSHDFRQGSDTDSWTATAGTVNYGSNGAEFTISKSGDAPTIETSFYFFFGQITVMLRAAPGTGIVSSVVLESDDLDEIDWEWLGGNSGNVQSNYFGKGNTTSYDRAVWHGVSPNTQDNLHNYTVLWTSEYTTWIIDGVSVRTLNYADAVGGENYPQTPMRLKLGTWAGGDSNNDAGTIGWAGGTTDYSQGPFTMYVESVSIVNFSPATSYSYGDTSGSWTSIKVDGGSVNSNVDGTATSSSGSTSTSTGSGMWWTASAAAVRAGSGAESVRSTRVWRCVAVAMSLALGLVIR